VKRLNVLHLEDNILDGELVSSSLADAGLTCDVLRVATETEFRGALKERKFNLIISDYSMPGFDGKSALNIARVDAPDTPFIFVSGTIGEEAAVESLLAGATDYVLKHKFARLIPAVQRALREADDRKERQLSEEALRVSEERYRQLFLSNPHPMWVYDFETMRFLAVNDAAVAKYGYSEDEFLRMTVAEIRPPDDVIRLVDRIANTPKSAENLSEWRHKTKDGRLLDVEIASNAIDFEGRPARLVLATDITEKKKIQTQLLRSQRMDTIGTLAGGIAHDLNNVLAPILMAVQVLKDRHKEETSQALLDTLEQSAKRGAGIVRQVLTFARGVDGQHVPLQPKHLLANMEKMVEQTFPKSVRLQNEIQKDLWLISGDPTQLDQVLLNLCVNARDAMPTGGIMKFKAENTLLDENYSRLNIDAKPGRYVVIEVSDTGHGIPRHIIDKIFEPFFTTKEVGSGTGLGLSTVMAIVKSHRGFVHVYSETEKGASFRIYLPALNSSDVSVPALSLSAGQSGNGELILVVDDEAAVRDIAQVTLQTYGYRAVIAKNGAEAVAVYAEHKDEIRAVLLDMMMPIMDGPATVHALTALNPAVRVIAASGLLETAQNAAVKTAAGSAIRAVLAKPYTAEKLLTTLHQVLTAV